MKPEPSVLTFLPLNDWLTHYTRIYLSNYPPDWMIQDQS